MVQPKHTIGYRLLNNKMCPLNIPEVPHSLNSFRIQTRLWSVNSSLLQIPQAFIDGILRKVHRSLVTWNAPSKKGKFEIFLGKVPPNNRYIIWIFTFFIFLNVFKVPHLARSQSNHIWCSLSECCGFSMLAVLEFLCIRIFQVPFEIISFKEMEARCKWIRYAVITANELFAEKCHKSVVWCPFNRIQATRITKSLSILRVAVCLQRRKGRQKVATLIGIELTRN